MNLKARAAHLKIGRQGERLAAKLLESKNCIILARDYRLRSGELDIVALDGKTVVFAEVKTLRELPGFEPGGNLSLRQIRRIFASARSYRRIFGLEEFPVRFDLIEVILPRNNPFRVPRIYHTPGALELERHD